MAEVGSPAWNAKLGKLLRRVQVGREVFGEQQGAGQ
jgi:antitoxin (DNA-binding transcriptional repressor) of toxin-antitoxin stability system